MIQNPEAMTGKIDKFDYTKLYKIGKNIISKVRKQNVNWENTTYHEGLM